MSSLHTLVEPGRAIPPPPQFIIKPSPLTPSGFPNFQPKIHDPEEDDVEILEDDEDDEDDLEGDEEEENEDVFTSYHLAPPNTTKNTSLNNSNNNNNHFPTPNNTSKSSGNNLPLQNNNFLSINHIISHNPPQTSTHTSHTSTLSPPQKKRETSQTSNIPHAQATSILQEGNAKKEIVDEENSLDLLKENRHLRKKVEGLMGHNMQLMMGIKERDHKIYKQKRLLLKYRKALLRFFEETETSSSSDDDLSPNEAKAKKKKDVKLDAHLKNMATPATPTPSLTSLHTPSFTPLHTPLHTPSLTTPTPTSLHGGRNSPSSSPSSSSPLPSFPSPVSYNDAEDKDDESLTGEFDFDNKKRKAGAGEFGELEPDKKRRGPRRNALWTPEDDEMFQKVYNVYGKSWKTIHSYMPGKTREQVQSHGQYLIRIGKLEDVKGGPRRGRKGKREKEKSSSPSPHHSSHSSHSTHTHTHSHPSPQPSASPSLSHTFTPPLHSLPPPLSHLPQQQSLQQIYDGQGPLIM
jgi:hypothetical protein